jgi:putative peptidoglycan lipid II flippase
MDAFNFAFQVPNLFRRLFGEGALTASFLPVYTKLDVTTRTPHGSLLG